MAVRRDLRPAIPAGWCSVGRDRSRPRPGRGAPDARHGPGWNPRRGPTSGPTRGAAETDDGGAVLVAERDGEVVGVCQLIVFRHLQARGGLCAEIESVHVHPTTGEWGRQHLAAEAIERPGARLLPGAAHLQRGAPDAHRFYERLGFVPVAPRLQDAP